MTRLPTRAVLLIAPLAAMLAACGGEAGTEGGSETSVLDDDEPTVVDMRQDNFEGIGDAFKIIRTQLEGTPEMAAIETAAVDINARAQKVAGFFPEGTSVDDGYDTEALAAIWERPEEFEEKAQDFVNASAEMVTLAAAGDPAAVGAHVATLGGTCKACHDNFRLDDD